MAQQHATHLHLAADGQGEGERGRSAHWTNRRRSIVRMISRKIVALFALSVANLSVVFGQSSPEAKSLRKQWGEMNIAFEKRVEEIEKARNDALAEVTDKYGKALTNIESQLMRAGDLDGAVAVRNRRAALLGLPVITTTFPG